MYSKIRNTLTALIAASLFVAAGWMIGHPVSVIASPADFSAPAAIDSGAQIAMDSTPLHAHHASRMSLAMPYYSFSLLTPQRRTD
jgi:hypothetical protein